MLLFSGRILFFAQKYKQAANWSYFIVFGTFFRFDYICSIPNFALDLSFFVPIQRDPLSR